MPDRHISAHPVPSTSSTVSLIHWPEYGLVYQKPSTVAGQAEKMGPQSQPLPQALSGSGRWAAGSISSPHLPMSTCENTSSRSSRPPAFGHLSHTEALPGKPHLATSSQVTASERNQTYRLGFWLRLFGELPKNSNLRVKGVWIGERLVKMSWRFTQVLSGTVAPKSRRSSSLWCSHSSVLGIPPHAQGHEVAQHPWSCPASHLGRGCESCLETRLCPRTHSSSSCYPADTLFLLAHDAKRGLRLHDSPSQEQTGESPSRGPHVEEPKVPTALPQPSPTCLDTMPPSGVGGGGDHTEGKKGQRDLCLQRRSGATITLWPLLPGCRNRWKGGWYHGAILALHMVAGPGPWAHLLSASSVEMVMSTCSPWGFPEMPRTSGSFMPDTVQGSARSVSWS